MAQYYAKFRSMIFLNTFYYDSYFDGYTTERGCTKSAQSEILIEKSDEKSPKHRCLVLV